MGKPTEAAMDRVMTEDHLLLAERHVAQAQRHIDQQRALLAHIRRVGGNVAVCEDHLAQLEVGLTIYRADRDRLRNKLQEAR